MHLKGETFYKISTKDVINPDRTTPYFKARKGLSPSNQDESVVKKKLHPNELKLKKRKKCFI